MTTAGIELRIIDRASPGLKQADANAKRLAKTVNGTTAATVKGSAGLGLYGKSARVAGHAALAATPKVIALGTAINAALGPIAAVGGAVALLTAGISELVKMDTAIAKFNTLGGSGEDLREELKGVAKEIDNAVSQADLAAAAYDVASAGFNEAADAAKILKVAAIGAQGGFSDMNTVAGATVKVLNAYGLGANKAEKLVDMFAQTQADGIITIDQYSQGIGKVASVAANLKVPLEEVNAAIALATKTGVRSEVAFTGMRASLARLAGEAGGKKLEKLGINISAATIQSEGLFANLKKLEGLSFKELESIFGQEAIQTIQPVLNNMKEYEQLIKNQTKSAGASKTAQEEMAGTIAGAWNRATNVIADFWVEQNELGELLENVINLTVAGLKLIMLALTPILNAVNDLLGYINKIIDGVKWLVKNAGDWLKKYFGPPLEKVEETTGKIADNVGEITDKIGEATGKKGGKDLKKYAETWKEIGNIIRNDVGEAIKGMLRGTKTLGEAALGILNKIADMFIDLAIQGMFTSLGNQGGFWGKLFGAANGAHWKGGFKAFAQGGMVNEPTLGLVGEGGESEYIIPESKMNDAMNRYAAGARGEDVLAGGGEAGGESSASGGSSGNINVTFASEVINDISYVTYAQFEAGVQQAAAEGAKRGEQATLRRLQTSPSTRRRVGV